MAGEENKTLDKDANADKVISTRHFEAPAPDNLNTELVDPENAVATTKEEEWITKKKTELTTTRQIETRVKRQVVLEDGKVVGDSGPMVTTSTTEDTEQHQHQQTEHRQIGDGETPSDGTWVSVSGAPKLMKEVKEHWTKSREEKEERTETEDVQHLGDITDEAFMTAIKSKESDVRQVLNRVSGKEVALSNLGSKLIHQSSKSRKVIDSEDTRHLSHVKEDGHLVTETQRTTQHEEINNDEVPDDDKGSEENYEETQESSQHYKKTKDQELVEYLSNGVKIGEQVRYEAENVEGDRHGDPASLELEQREWDSLSARIRKLRRKKQLLRNDVTDLPAGKRKDVLIEKPLDLEMEEETRKVETSRWLENHFGSESRSSKDSFGDEEDTGVKTNTSTSFINVTMKSTKNQLPSYSSLDGIPKSTSRGIVSSPEPMSPKNEYFQGISEWKNKERVTSPDYSSFNKSSEKYQQSNGYHYNQIENKPIGRTQSFNHVSPVEKSTNRIPDVPRSNSHVNGTVQNGHKERYSYSRRYAERNTTPQSELDSLPLYSTVQKRLNRLDKEESSRESPIEPIRTSTPDSDYKINSAGHTQYSRHYSQKSHGVETHINDSRIGDPVSGSGKSEKEYSYHSWNRKQNQSNGYDPADEPSPDYSPTTEHRRRDTPSPNPDSRKKFMQKTRFASDSPTEPEEGKPDHRKSSLGESFRKIIGKFRSSSSERKAAKDKKRKESILGKFGWDGKPSGDGVGDRRGGHVTSEVVEDLPVAPPRTWRQSGRSRVDSGTQTLDRGSQSKKKEMDRNGASSPVVQRFYLGEDPFNGSIYGKEREYDGVTPHKKKSRRGSHQEEERQYRSYVSSSVNNHNSSTLGRYSRSTGKLIADSEPYRNGVNDHIRGGIQTLPRKLRDERHVKKQVTVTRSNGDHSHYTSEAKRNGNLSDHHSGSTFNVSFINQNNGPSPRPIVNTGPAKPARTYRSSLSRSKSFNVHAGEPEDLKFRSSVYTSNPQLSSLDENSAPLKSPGIVTSISRSTKNLVDAITEEEPTMNGYSSRGQVRLNSPNHLNGSHTSRERHDTKRKVFMKGLYDRAPELFKTIHGDVGEDAVDGLKKPVTSTPLKNGSRSRSGESEFNSWFDYPPTSDSPVNGTALRTGGEETNRSVVRRRGSNDDYSETVRITSKSNDPLRPSVTNTVKNFSKKTIPNKDGKAETIESTETTTVTKSRFKSNGESSNSSDRSSFFSSPVGHYKNGSNNERLVVTVRNGH